MRFVLATFLLTGTSLAADLPSKLLRLIGPDATIVASADLERQSNSVLNPLFTPSVPPGGGLKAPSRVLWVEYGTPDSSSMLTAAIGPLPPRNPDEDGAEPTLLDSNTAVSGDPRRIREAQQRWKTALPLTPMAAKVLQLSQSYDSWMILEKPLAFLADLPATPDVTAVALKYRAQILDAVEEISLGIRFGQVDEFHVEAVFRTAEDASAVATLARWLPGLLQLGTRALGPPLFVNAMEGFTVLADGRRVTLSARLPEDQARVVMEKWHSRLVE